MTDTLDDNPGAGRVFTIAMLEGALRRSGMAEADMEKVLAILRAGQAAEVVTRADGDTLRLAPAGTGLYRAQRWAAE